MSISTQQTADLSAAASAGLAASTWVVELNTLLQLGATIVAILAGMGAAWWHFERAIAARRERLDEDKSGTNIG